MHEYDKNLWSHAVVLQKLVEIKRAILATVGKAVLALARYLRIRLVLCLGSPPEVVIQPAVQSGLICIDVCAMTLGDP